MAVLWLAWYAGMAALAFVWLVGGAVGPRLHYVEALAAALALGAVASTWAVFLVSALAFSALTQGAVLAASLALAYAAARRWADFRREHALMRLSRDDALALAVTGALALLLAPTYWRRMIPERDGRLVSGGSCYGDLPIHMTIANSLLVGCNTHVSLAGMQSPIFAGRRMTYPFLPDFHAAIVVTLGGSMRDGFLLPGLSLCLALWALLYFFALRVTRSRLGAVMAVLMVVGAGGLGAWRWVWQEWRANPARGLYAAFCDVLRDKDVVQHDPTGEWKHLWFAFVPHIMLPQRGANFAYPLVVLVLTLVWMATDHSSLEQLSKPTTQGHRRAMLVTAGVLSAALPLFQAHSFIGVGIIVGTVAALDAHKWLADGHLLASWALAGAAAALLGGPQIAMFRQTVEEGFYGKFFTYGWLFNNYEFGEPHNSPLGLLRFWWHSLGPCLHLFLAAFALYGLEAAAARRWRLSLLAGAGPGPGAGPAKGAAGAALPLMAMQIKLAQGAFGGGARGPPGGAGAALPSAVAGRLTGGAGDDNGPPSPKSNTVAPNFKALLLPPFGARWLGLDQLDAALHPLNALSPSGRALDALKLMLGALLVFGVANYVNFQPWDRDNAKIYYVFIFVAAPINGALLAAPFEYFLEGRWEATPGARRIAAWCGGAAGGASAAAGAGVGAGAAAAAAAVAAIGAAAGAGAGASADATAAAGTSSGVRPLGGSNSGSRLRSDAAAGGGGGAAAQPSPPAGLALRHGQAPRLRRLAELGVAHAGRLAAVPLFLLCVGSGLMMLLNEYNDAAYRGGALLDEEALDMGTWVRRHVPQRAVVMHSNVSESSRAAMGVLEMGARIRTRSGTHA